MNQKYSEPTDLLVTYTPTSIFRKVRKMLVNREVKEEHSKVEITTLEKNLLVLTIETRLGTLRKSFVLEEKRMTNVTEWLSELWTTHIDLVEGLFL